MRNSELIDASTPESQAEYEAKAVAAVISKQQYQQWLHSPETQTLVAALTKAREAHVTAAENLMLSNPTNKDSIVVHLIESALMRQLLEKINTQIL